MGQKNAFIHFSIPLGKKNCYTKMCAALRYVQYFIFKEKQTARNEFLFKR